MPSNNLPKKHYTECKNQFKVHRNKTVWDLAQHWLQTGLCEPFEAYLLGKVFYFSIIILIFFSSQFLHRTSFSKQLPFVNGFNFITTS